MKTVLLCAAVILAATPARADKIDGAWCSPSGERMTIDGENVTTPGGASVTARYTRHSIEYAVPDGERPPEGRIHAEQLDDTRIDVSRLRKTQPEPPAHDIWTRCEEVS